MQYRLEVKYSGWMTHIIEASSLEEAKEKAAVIPEGLLVKDLSWKEIEMQDDTGGESVSLRREFFL